MPAHAPRTTHNAPTRRSRRIDEFFVKHPNELMARRRPKEYLVRTLEEFMSMAPERIKHEILAYYLLVEGAIRVARNRVHGGKAISAEELTIRTIKPFPCSPVGVGRTAKQTFYKVNTFCLARTHLPDQTYRELERIFLPHEDARHWIRHLEVRLRIAPLRKIPHFSWNECKCPLQSKYECKHSDWPFLRKLASGACGFKALETLDLVFLGQAMTAAELEAFDQELKRRSPFLFNETWQVRVSFQIDLRAEDRKESAAVQQPDEKVAAVLLRHMSTNNSPPPDAPQPQSPGPKEQVECRKDRIRRRFTSFMVRFRSVRNGAPSPEPLPDKDSETSDSSS
ncbi:hypothetical protein E8E11_006409 [Didymella keratinophila]|nr:hypothetical protein E8E11_006409 [Didymella keratinophila]